MAMNTGFQHQQPLGFSAAVRSTPSPQHAAHFDIAAEAACVSTKAPVEPEEKSFAARQKR